MKSKHPNGNAYVTTIYQYNYYSFIQVDVNLSI